MSEDPANGDVPVKDQSADISYELTNSNSPNTVEGKPLETTTTTGEAIGCMPDSEIQEVTEEHPGVTDQSDPGVVDQSDQQSLRINVDKAADSIAFVVCQHCEESQLNNQKRFTELIKHQNVLLESIQHENNKFESSEALKTMEDTMSKCKEYYNKLMKVKRSMADISQRTANLKKQCSRLQKLKQDHVVADEEARQKELAREKLLTAKYVPEPL